MSFATDKDRPGSLVWEFGPPETLEQRRRERSGWRPDRLRRPGLSPATVIDVGAATGTPELYEAFPEAHLVLIEPLEECREALERWLSTHRGERVESAIGGHEGDVVLHVDRESPWVSSILQPVRPHEGAAPVERRVAMTTLDRLLEAPGWKPPFGLKVDSEGFELEVVKGATRLLAETQFVIAEVSVTPRFEGGYSFAEFIAAMDDRGFALSDVLDGWKVRPAGSVIFLDALFTRAR
jgi:FkbM family methyltransferase